MIRSISRISVKKEAHSPYIGANGNWWEWDAQLGRYKDTGVKAQGDRGPQGVRPSVTVYRPNTLYYAGNEGEPVLDYVFYKGRYYRCTKTHISKANTNLENPFDEVGHGYDTWALETNHEFVATKVLFAGDDGNGWIMEGGVIRHTSGNVSLAEDGSIVASNGKFKLNADGDIVANSGTFSGFLKMPFKRFDEGATFVSAGVYRVRDSFNLRSEGSAYGYSITLQLPNDSSLSGTLLTVYDSPIKTKSSPVLTISCQSGSYIYHPSKKGTYGLTAASSIICSRGGLIQLLCVETWPGGNSCSWMVVTDIMPDAVIQ